MHPLKDTLNRDYDLTDKFKGFIESIIKDAQKALILADCPCPYPAETQMSKILNSVREATQVVHTVANDYQHRVPDSPEKEAVIREAWEKVETIDAKQSDAFLPPSESADDLLDSLVKAFGKPVYNCCPGNNSAGDFALWLAERIKGLQTKVELLVSRNKELLAELEFHAGLVSKAKMVINADEKHAESNEKEVGTKNGESADDEEKYRKLLFDADSVCDYSCRGRHHCEGHRICDRCGSPKCGCDVKYSEREQMFLCNSCQEECRKANR